jgi:hypothetical protein
MPRTKQGTREDQRQRPLEHIHRIFQKGNGLNALNGTLPMALQSKRVAKR